MSTQPTLLPEGTYTDAEKAFIELSPPGLWPENQNSNFGQFRKIVTDIIQECIDEIDHLGEEMFVQTAVEYLPQWEEIARVPISPSGKTTTERRAIIAGRLKYGPFTRARIRSIVEGYLNVTFGDAVSLTPIGVSLPAGGTSLLSGVTSLLGAYRVYEDVRNYAYSIWIKSAMTPDLASLTKELNRITPAGIAVTIDNAHADVLNYHRTVRNKQPVLYLRLNGADATDEGGYADNGTVNGAPAAFAAPGLLHANVQHDLAGNTDAALDFDGVNDYVSIPHAAQLNVGDNFSIEGWFNFDAFTGSPRLVTKGGLAYELYVDTAGQLRLQIPSGAVLIAHSSINLTAATNYHIVATKAGDKTKLAINGVDRAVIDSTVAVCADNTNALEIGRIHNVASNWLNARGDEIALYNYPLTMAQIIENYNTGRDIP